MPLKENEYNQRGILNLKRNSIPRHRQTLASGFGRDTYIEMGRTSIYVFKKKENKLFQIYKKFFVSSRYAHFATILNTHERVFAYNVTRACAKPIFMLHVLKNSVT